MLADAFLSELQKLLPVRREEPMARHTTFHIGGPADAYVQARTCQQLQKAVALALHWEVPLFVLGAGSNLLVGDKGIHGLVVETWANEDLPAERLQMKASSCVSPVRVWAFCGMPLPRLAYQTARAGLAGLEWAVGIPGTVGGGVVNNAGAHGGAMADVVRLILVQEAGGQRVLTQEELAFGYRVSHFRGPAAELGTTPVILAAELELTPEAPEMLEARIAENVAHRRTTQPSQRSMGSIFKNPEGHAAGWLIEQVGLKGHRIGDAQISAKHANFIVNRGRATATEVNELIYLAQERVAATFGIQLELEIQSVGERV